MTASSKRLQDPKLGFRDLGAWAQAVRRATAKDTRVSFPEDGVTVLRAASTFGTATVATEGGYAVPPTFAARIEHRISETSIAALCDRAIITKGGLLTTVHDDSTAWGTSQLEWEGESATHVEKKPALQASDLPLRKLSGWIAVTSELWDDAPGLGAFLERRIAADVAYKLNFSILRGDGVQQPLGIENSPALISVAKEGGQAADTIKRQNLLKMFARLHVERPESVAWLCHPTAISQIFEELSECVPDGKLFGHRIIRTQACDELGDKFDVIVGDWSGYLLASKAAQIVNSLHFLFDQDMNVFRYTLRINGQPWSGTTYADRDGSGTTSPFVVLDERA